MHSEDIIAGIAIILALGLAAQWLAVKLRLPSILLLLATGILVGPVFGIIDPDELFGNLLFPLVSISVALILYEGGLDLRVSELRSIRPVVLKLVTIGALVTWLVATLAARFVLGMSYELSVLLGAILIVSGPTVVLPLLLHIRPERRVSSLLKWEGIFIDPVGAIIAVIVLQAIVSGDLGNGTFQWSAMLDVALTFLIGGVIGIAAGGALTYALKQYLLPDVYQNMLSLTAVVGTFALSNAARAESGLFAVILMGLLLANQPFVSVRRIVHFKENLRVVILSMLFIVLAARLERDALTSVLSLKMLAFLLILVLVARPLATFVSTLGSPLSWQQRVFTAWVCPRGIVAASVASIFGIELAEAGVEGGELLTPYIFAAIIGTVLIYGLTAPPLARYLKLANRGPAGAVILGAHPLAQEIGLSLMQEGFPTLLVDANRTNIQGARLAGLRTFYGNILADETLEELDLAGIDIFVAMTPNDEVNALAAIRMSEIFQERNIYQVAPEGISSGPGLDSSPARHLRGRILGYPRMSLREINSLLRAGWTIKRTVLTERYTFDDFLKQYGSPLVLFVVTRNRVLRPISPEQNYTFSPGDKLIALVHDESRQVRTAVQVSPDRVLTTEEMEAAGLISSFCEWHADVSSGRAPRRREAQPTPVGNGK